jgi:riboflavin synthase
MFTGIIEDVGTITAVRQMAGRWEFGIRTSLDLRAVHEGDSIAVDGVCLTVTRIGDGSFYADASLETLNVTTLSEKKAADPVNLEQAMRADARFGGHFVMGHVDAVGRVAGIAPAGDSTRLTVEISREIARYIVAKGSIALNGISLTVNETSDTTFTVNIIPYSAAKTTISRLVLSEKVNIETDILGRYVEKFLGSGEKSGTDLEFLYNYGYVKGR